MTTSNVSPFVKTLTRGINMAAKGTTQQKEGTAIASVAIVLLLQERHNDSESYDQLVKHCAGVHVNAKEQPAVFKASWEFWSELISERFAPLTKDESKDMDVSDRREENDPI